MHKSFYFPELNVVFTGDALINGACGRLLGGTAEQLYRSLAWVASLPDETRIFGGHDYLLENLRFAATTAFSLSAVERRRQQYKSDPMKALFATVAVERETNPFLSCSSVAGCRCARAKIGFNASAFCVFDERARVGHWRCRLGGSSSVRAQCSPSGYPHRLPLRPIRCNSLR